MELMNSIAQTVKLTKVAGNIENSRWIPLWTELSQHLTV